MVQPSSQENDVHPFESSEEAINQVDQNGAQEPLSNLADSSPVLAEGIPLPNACQDSTPQEQPKNVPDLSALSPVKVPEQSKLEKAADGAATLYHLGEKVQKTTDQLANQCDSKAATAGQFLRIVFDGDVDIGRFKAIGLTAISSLASATEALPIFGPVGKAVKELVGAIDRKKQNDIKVKRIVPRVNDVLESMLETQREAPQKTYQDLKEHIDAIVTVIKKLVDFFEKFFKKGMFVKLITTSITATTLDELDKELIEKLQKFTLKAINKSLQLHKATEAVVKGCQEQMLRMQAVQQQMHQSVKTRIPSGVAPSLTEDSLKACNPELFGHFAQVCGLHNKEAIAQMKLLQKQNILQAEKFEEAKQACVEKVDKVLEKIGSWVEDTRRMVQKEMKEIGDKLDDFSKVSEKNQHEVLKISRKMDESVSRLIDTKNQIGKLERLVVSRLSSGNNGVPEQLIYTTKHGSKKLGKLANEAMVGEGCFIETVIHSCGVDGSQPRLDGRNGCKGRDGLSSSADGGDGMVGEMGKRGLDCDDFHVEMVTLTDEQQHKWVAISHSGQKGRVEWKPWTHDEFFFIDGRGGSGGAGGDGGDGEDGMDQVGRPGGKGGRAAKGGKGGAGGGGARVVVTTTDPLLLMRILVDCTGGEGGVGGHHGEVGSGGTGNPHGKDGKLPQSYAMSGDPGSEGAVAFRIVEPFESPTQAESSLTAVPSGDSDVVSGSGTVRRLSNCSASSLDRVSNSGVLEFGGEPYRLIFHEQGEDDEGRTSTSYGPSPCNQLGAINVERRLLLHFLYGEQVVLGPYKPTNVGSLSCPESQLHVALLDEYGIEMVEAASESFLGLPPASHVRYGICEEDPKDLTLCLPSWEAWGAEDLGGKAARIDDEAQKLPLSQHWSPRTRTTAYAKASWTVDGIAFVPYRDVRPNGETVVESTQIETELTVDLPMRLARLTVGGGLKLPQLLAINHDTAAQASLALIFYAPFDPAKYQHAIRFCADGFHPVVKVQGGKSEQIDGQLTQLTSSHVALDTQVPQNAVQEYAYTVELPVGPQVLPGSTIQLRPELRKQDDSGVWRVVSYGPCSRIRLAPPPPPSNPSQVSSQVVMLTDRHTRTQDFVALSSACALLELQGVFLDTERFRDPAGLVQANMWGVQKGQATLVWVPSKANSQRIPVTQLEEHVRTGGRLVTNLPIAASKQAVTNDASVALAFNETDQPRDLSTSGHIGAAVWPLVSALIRSRPPSVQLAMLSRLQARLELPVAALNAAKTSLDGTRAKRDSCCCVSFEQGFSFYGPESGKGAPTFRAGQLQHPPSGTQLARVTVREALVSWYASKLAAERWAAVTQRTVAAAPQSRPYTDAFLVLAKRPASAQDAALWLGMMEDSSLHSWTTHCDRDAEDHPEVPTGELLPSGVWQALSMCGDVRQPYLDIKVAWLQCRKLASTKDALEVCSRIRAVRAALAQEQQRRAAANKVRQQARDQADASALQPSRDWNRDEDFDDDEFFDED